MKKYNRSEVMARAWRILRNFPNLSWSKCLTRAWAIEKEKPIDISPVVMNKILNGLKSFNRSRTMSENKPMLAGTQEHFKFLNSRKGRQILKLPVEDDSREMLEQGELFAFDIMHQRIKESKRFVEPTHKIKKSFRNRIVDYANCVPVNITEYCNGN